MVVFSVKTQNIKFIFSIICAVAAIILAVSLIPHEDDFVYPEEVIPAVRTVSEKELKNLSDNEKRVEIIKKYGWEIDPEPIEISETVIPEKFDGVYKRYNEMQISEGFDLTKYKGKTVKRYVYELKNFDYDGTCIVTVLLYRDKLIGGDVSSKKLDGFVRGLSKGNDFIF